MAVTYFARKSKKLLEVVRELLHRELYNYIIILLLCLLLLTTLTFLVLFLLITKSLVDFPASSLVTASTYLLSLMKYAFEYLAG